MLLLLTAGSAAAQCSGDALLDPEGSGANGQTRLQNFLTLVDDLYSNPNVTKRLFFNGKWHLVAPWYRQSDRCSEADLQSYAEFTSPTFSRYLVNGDELSELAVVTALANSEQRMIEIHHTVQAMISGSAHPGLPCWLAKVENGVLSCLRTDTASDITARVGLAYLFAAQNPDFSQDQRTVFTDTAAELARDHLEAEYVNFDPQVEACPAIAPTSRPICDWAGGGGNTASRGSFQAGATHMWTGYYQDIVRFLIAIAESESDRDSALASRALQVADQVVEQWLGASRFDGSSATFGDKEFTWDSAVVPIRPRTLSAWDYDDAPRALWMGDVLRAIHLHTQGAPLAGAYARLSAWVQLLLAGDTQRATCSVVKYSPDGEALVPCNAGYYENGLGAGLFTFHATDLLDEKLDATLAEYRWAEKRWRDESCFGIYRPIRPLKALATAIGLDSAAYGCAAAPPALHLLSVQPSGTGSGTVTSSPAGIACGTDCSESYPAGTSVTLTASPAAGSSFTGWGGDCSGAGACTVTMDFDRSVSATFAANCPAAPTWLRVSTVSQTRLDLLWQDNSTNESGFKVERKEGCCGPWTLLPSAPANATTYQSTGLKCGTTYAYRVWAFSGGCESAKTNEAAAATSACTVPAAPSWLRVTPISSSRIDLRWDDNSTNEDGFSIERKQGCCGPWTPLPAAPANATTYQSTGLACGTSYAYRVRAFNAAGSSNPANEAATTTLACP
jgi:hypothetical protein